MDICQDTTRKTAASPESISQLNLYLHPLNLKPTFSIRKSSVFRTGVLLNGVNEVLGAKREHLSVSSLAGTSDR